MCIRAHAHPVESAADGAGVGFGAERQIAGTVGVGLNRMGMIYNGISLANTWNRYSTRSAAFLTMDRVYRLMPPMEVLYFFLKRPFLPRLEAKKMGGISKMPPKQP